MRWFYHLVLTEIFLKIIPKKKRKEHKLVPLFSKFFLFRTTHLERVFYEKTASIVQ